ncbi:hypothetical protein EV363DRAFT_1399162 [Boletus edulis]|nr:hypothetical protein EV363DRAFT_1399162 [Boletus edulis]
MAPNLTSGTFSIVSLIDGNPPVGVNFTRPAGQSVYLNAPWAVKQEGDNTYRLSVGGYRYTRVVDNRVTASIFPEKNVDISPINDDIVGWTVAYDDPNSKVTLRVIVAVGPWPPLFLPPQLFRFEEVDE